MSSCRVVPADSSGGDDAFPWTEFSQGASRGRAPASHVAMLSAWSSPVQTVPSICKGVPHTFLNASSVGEATEGQMIFAGHWKLSMPSGSARCYVPSLHGGGSAWGKACRMGAVSQKSGHTTSSLSRFMSGYPDDGLITSAAISSTRPGSPEAKGVVGTDACSVHEATASVASSATATWPSATPGPSRSSCTGIEEAAPRVVEASGLDSGELEVCRRRRLCPPRF
jgi:hypothetical protein